MGQAETRTQAKCPRGPAPRPRACVLTPLDAPPRADPRDAAQRRWLGGTASAQRGRAMQPSCQELRMQHMALTICTRTPNLEHGACARDRRRAAVEATPVSERALMVLASPRASATHVLMRPPRALQLFCSVLPHRARRRNIQLQLQCRHCGTARLSTPALTLPSTPARRRRRPSHAAHAVLPLQHLRHAARSAPSPRHSLRCKSLLLAQAAVSALPRRPRGLALPAARVSACARAGLAAGPDAAVPCSPLVAAPRLSP